MEPLAEELHGLAAGEAQRVDLQVLGEIAQRQPIRSASAAASTMCMSWSAQPCSRARTPWWVDQNRVRESRMPRRDIHCASSHCFLRRLWPRHTACTLHTRNTSCSSPKPIASRCGDIPHESSRCRCDSAALGQSLWWRPALGFRQLLVHSPANAQPPSKEVQRLPWVASCSRNARLVTLAGLSADPRKGRQEIVHDAKPVSSAGHAKDRER